jgi:hypothetical protein
MWGNWILVSLQWAFFRFQYTAQGSGFIPVNREINFIQLGYTSGVHTLLAVTFWTAGSILLITGILLTGYAGFRGNTRHIRQASFLTLGAGVFFGLSAIERFTAGFAIPLGLPLLFAIAWIMYHQQPEAGENNDTAADDNEKEAAHRKVG